MPEFTFVINDGQKPEITIFDFPFAIVSFTYNWTTATDKSPGTNVIIAAGYLNKEPVPRIFKLDFKTKKATEL